MPKTFLVVCLNPTLQKTFRFDTLALGQVNRITSIRLDLAGKGVSTTRVLDQLGERAVHLTQAGGEHLETFRRLVAEDGLDVRYVPGEIEIRYCYTLLNGSDRSTTEIVEPGSPASPGLEEAIRDSYRSLIEDAHTVIVTGSKAPGFSDEIFPDMVAQAHARGLRVILDIRGADLLHSLPHRPDLVKVNVNEFSATFLDAPVPEETDPSGMPPDLFEHMHAVVREWGCRLVLTNGARPVMYVEDGAIRMIEPVRVEPVNAIGSGDAVTAGIAAGVNRGLPLREAVALGLDCARRNVALEKPGTIR
jgi:fructose-1-phosphate kinase PfkB-like protein